MPWKLESAEIVPVMCQGLRDVSFFVEMVVVMLSCGDVSIIICQSGDALCVDVCSLSFRIVCGCMHAVTVFGMRVVNTVCQNCPRWEVGRVISAECF